MAALPHYLATATCITCSSVFYERDEDGCPEIPGQRCAIEGCPSWICDGGCLDHHSLACDCGQRVCPEHIVERQGFGRMCSACAERLVSVCRECDAAPVERRYADGLGACSACDATLHRETYGFPACPECGHRFWVRDMDSRVFTRRGGLVVVENPRRMFACACGLKFTREMAAGEKKEPASEASRGLFAPREGRISL